MSANPPAGNDVGDDGSAGDGSAGDGPSGDGQTPAVRAVDSPLGEVKFLTVAEVATVMRVSKMTVYRMVHAGELPAVRVGRSFRVQEKGVHEYLRGAFVEAG